VHAPTPLAVRCTTTPTALEVEVIDCGDGFEPGDVHQRPPLEHPGHLDRERGWGVHLMRVLVDDLEFDLTGTGTTVRLRIARR
jgi:anti-sigma regulatory factor (Ser/Thr protein kinase)